MDSIREVNKMNTIKKKLNLKKQARFINALTDTGNVSRSASTAGIKRSTLYKWRNEDQDFASRWDEALEECTCALEGEAIRRAKEGSDTLLIFLLKALRPEKYGQAVRHVGKSTAGEASSLNYGQLSDEQLARISSGEPPRSVMAN